MFLEKDAVVGVVVRLVNLPLMTNSKNLVKVGTIKNHFVIPSFLNISHLLFVVKYNDIFDIFHVVLLLKFVKPIPTHVSLTLSAPNFKSSSLTTFSSLNVTLKTSFKCLKKAIV